MTLSAEQISMRSTGIGASDIGAVAGLSPWSTPMDVYLAKIGLGATRTPTPAMLAGVRLEPVIADWYAEETGADLAMCETMRHPEHSWMIATPDRRTSDRLVEIKAVGWRQAGSWGNEPDAIPDYYRAQVEWQMDVCGVDRCDVAVLIAGQDFRIYPITRDAGLAERLRAVGLRFWAEHVLARRPPAAMHPEDRARLAEALFPRASAKLAPATPAANDLAARLIAARATRKAAETAEDALIAELKHAIGDAEGVDGGSWRATWKAPSSGSVKWAQVARAMNPPPELVAKYTEPPTRRFTFRTKEEE